jgi:hypothetical protein
VWVSVIERIFIWSDAIKALRALNLDLRPSTFTVAMFMVLGPPPGAVTELGSVLYINGGKLGRTSVGASPALKGEVDRCADRCD